MIATKEPKQVRGPGNRPLSVLRETKRRPDERGGTMLRTAALIAVAAAAIACGSLAVQAARGAGSSGPLGLTSYGRLVWIRSSTTATAAPTCACTRSASRSTAAPRRVSTTATIG